MIGRTLLTGNNSIMPTRVSADGSPKSTRPAASPSTGAPSPRSARIRPTPTAASSAAGRRCCATGRWSARSPAAPARPRRPSPAPPPAAPSPSPCAPGHQPARHYGRIAATRYGRDRCWPPSRRCSHPGRPSAAAAARWAPRAVHRRLRHVLPGRDRQRRPAHRRHRHRGRDQRRHHRRLLRALRPGGLRRPADAARGDCFVLDEMTYAVRHGTAALGGATDQTGGAIEGGHVFIDRVMHSGAAAASRWPSARRWRT
jgi:hypothetical protein